MNRKLMLTNEDMKKMATEMKSTQVLVGYNSSPPPLDLLNGNW